LNFLRKNFEKIEKKNSTWYHGASRQITWYHVMSRCITRDITSDHVIWRDITWSDVISRDLTWYHVIWRDITWYATLNWSMKKWKNRFFRQRTPTYPIFFYSIILLMDKVYNKKNNFCFALSNPIKKKVEKKDRKKWYFKNIEKSS